MLPKNLLTAAYWQNLVYSNAEFNNATFIKTKHMYAAVFEAQKQIFVIIRGSDAANDWKDINRKFRKTSQGIHEGFAEAAQEIEQKVVDLLWSMPSLPIVWVGHSMGGAVAQVLAYRLHDWARTSQVITFGAPRVFSRRTSKDYDRVLEGKTVHVVNKLDFVPEVPWIFGSFRRTAYTLYLPAGLKASSWHRPFRSFLSVFPKALGIKGMDHDSRAYLSTVSTYVTERLRKEAKKTK